GARAAASGRPTGRTRRDTLFPFARLVRDAERAAHASDDGADVLRPRGGRIAPVRCGGPDRGAGGGGGGARGGGLFLHGGWKIAGRNGAGSSPAPPKSEPKGWFA